MSDSRKGIRLPLSPARRLVVELLHHAKKVPSLPLKMPLNVGQLAAARATCESRPSWIGIFLKAFALVARERPELRRVFMPWPRAHLYEHPISECAVLVERDWNGEKAVLAAKLRDPATQSLASIDQHLQQMRTTPFEEQSDMRQLARIARMPGWMRRILFSFGLYTTGRMRAKKFGTFMISTLGDLGAEQCHPIAPMTSYLSFGPIQPNGDVVALLVYDHRVLDGRAVARTLLELGEALNGPILAEIESLARRVAA